MLYTTLDIGTNSVLLLIAGETPDGQLTEQQEYFQVTRLGEKVDQTGRLQPAAIQRTLAVIREFFNRIPRDQGPGQGVAAATSAVRDAVNRHDFIDPCTEILGAPPRILSGAEEARTVFLGATSDQPPEKLLVTIDVGGGSTEIGVGTSRECQFADSLNLGCVRLAERYDLLEAAPSRQHSQARHEIQQILRPVAMEVQRRTERLPAPPLVLASGGTATTFAAYQLRLSEYQRHQVHGYQAIEIQIADAADILQKMPAAQRAQCPGINPGRAPVLPAGLLILSEFLRMLGAASCQTTTRGLRFGLARRLQAGELKPTWTMP